MKLLLDMNLSPGFVALFEQQGWSACHWSEVGDIRAADPVIMEWARTHGYIVVTHDLDFGAILAVTQAKGPSVVQVRTQDVTPNHLAPILITTLSQYESMLTKGALVIVHEQKSRVRILPLSLN